MRKHVLLVLALGALPATQRSASPPLQVVKDRSRSKSANSN